MLGGIMIKAPVTVYLEVTRRCNLNCEHCLIPKENNDLDLKTGKKIIDQIADSGVFKIYFTGGEPLLYPYTFELIEYANKKGLYTLLQTNGTLIDEFIEKIKKSKIGVLDISILGLEEIHDLMTRKKCFEKIMKNAKILEKEGIRYFLSYVVTSKSVSDLMEFIEYCLEKKIKLMHIRRYIERYKNDPLSPDPSELRSVFKKYYRKKLEIEKKGLHIELEEGFAGFERIKENPNCSAGTLLCGISVNARIMPCNYLLIEGEKIDSFRDVWDNSTVLNSVRNVKKMDGKCGNCYNFDFCKGGCRAAAYYTSNIKGEDPCCWITPDI